MTPSLRIARLAGAVALLLAVAYLFLPTTLGGGTTYVTTAGDSMQPRFHTGDLAILRTSDDYAVGDVVAFRSAELGTSVMHRIVDTDGPRFITQGDNNSWLDPEEPTTDQIIGKLWFGVPQAGKAFALVRSPWAFALTGTAALLITLATARRPGGRRTGTRRRIPPAFSHSVRARARQATPAAGAAALLAAAGLGALFLVPDTQAGTRSLEVTQEGRFTYTGTAVPSTTYPTGVIETGDPVWTNLTDGLTVSFENVVTGASDVAGNVRLEVSVGATDGWTARLAVGPAAPLVDGAATASVFVDPAAATALVDRHYAEIGASGAAGTLTVVPVVEAAGTVEGLPFTARSPDGLSFSMDATAVRLAGDAASLSTTDGTTVSTEELAPRSFALGAVAVSITQARITAGTLLAVALVALGISAAIARPGGGTEVDRFLARHAGRILTVSRFTPGSTTVDLSDAEALSRVAERLDGLVLHHEGPCRTTFAVRDGETTYRYVVRPVPVPVPVPREVTVPRPAATPSLLRRFA